ncbi:uncharacterized protein LODBEIA_P55380 [Lodderomyces beijingensis]|uniref:chitinase n=1 Tax=Lodderomyces beijingensis TaxID=1775926 RepID=A0ABP0ZTU6_9ASCO
MLAKTVFAVLAASLTSVVASGNQVALYWGQNGAGGQERLSYYCQDAGVDIVLLSFLNDFPDPTNVNFANQCGNQYPSGLLHCSQIGEDIKTCQASGKKVLLSLGGAAGTYGFNTPADGAAYADVLWNKFGAGTEDSERPFDDAVVDGFDFDIELGSDVGYPELAQALRSKFRRQSAKSYYLSASPQCPYPDSKVGALMAQEQLDYAFIQFYNNYCSANGDFNYDTWANYAAGAPNPNIELFVGLPSTGNIDGYVDADKVGEIVQEISCNRNFAGISLWDASGAWLNANNEGQNFVAQVKDQLNQHSCAATTTSTVNETSESANETSEVPPVDETSENDTQTTTDATTANTATTATTTSTTNAAANETSDEPESQATVTATTDAVDETSEDSETQVSTVAPGQSSVPTTVYDPTSSVQATVGYQNSTNVETTALPPTAVAPGAASGTSGTISTITAVGTTVITITSCSNNVCTHVPVTTGIVTVTQLDTTYTTFCPLTASTSLAPGAASAPGADNHNKQIVSNIKTTVLTITSCENNYCQIAPVTTGVQVVTDAGTVYTTYCPLPATSAATAAAASSAIHEEDETSYVTVHSTVYTYLPTSVAAAQESASTLTAGVPVVQQSTGAQNGTEPAVEPIPVYEGGASVLNSGVVFSVAAVLVGMALF